MVYTLLSGAMVYTLFPLFPNEVVCTLVFLLCDLGVGRQTKRSGVSRWWYSSFFSLFVVCGAHLVLVHQFFEVLSDSFFLASLLAMLLVDVMQMGSVSWWSTFALKPHPYSVFKE